jgi:hypothetical protein
MRYFKDSIAMSPNRDLPLLRQVMNSKYVTETQLWQFMEHRGCERNKGSFWWRVKRLTEHRFVARHLLPMVNRDPIYAITPSGLVYLNENCSVPYGGPKGGPDIRADGAGVAHALGVNGVHLDLLRGARLLSWEYEIEIRYRSESIGAPAGRSLA